MSVTQVTIAGAATSTTNPLPVAATIDATQDYLPIYTASLTATQAINRNVFLGITGSPVGTSDSQALTNKTIGNTNTVTLKDALFTLQDDGDATKQVQLQLSGITSGNTRTITVPDANLTLVGLATTQTLTNKTLTSPTINSPTITNATIDADALTGHASSSTGTVYGISVSSAKISGTVISNTTIPYTALDTGSTWAWSSWTPSWTNLTVGNGTQK